MKILAYPLNERLAPADLARVRQLAAARGITPGDLLETTLKRALHAVRRERRRKGGAR